MKSVSIVVPVYNEEDNIEHFTAAIHEVMDGLGYDYELIFVNDGSVDRSAAILAALSKRDERVKYFQFSRNFGHQAAITCGLDHAGGDAVITMDGDMQHPPELLPELLSRWEQGFEVVQTIRITTEGVSLFKNLTSKLYYKLLNSLSDVHVYPGGSDFRLLDRQAVLAFRRYREHARFVRGLVASIGFRQTQVEFTAPPRFAGESKFSLKKMVNLALNGLLTYSVVPLRAAFYLGLFAAVGCLLLMLHAVYEYIAGDVVPGWSTLMVTISFFGSVQLVILGIVGEYIGRIFEEVKRRPLYLLENETEGTHEETDFKRG